MNDKRSSDEALTNAVKELQQGRATASEALKNNSIAIAVCELVRATLESKSQGEDYFKLSSSELRRKLGNRDLIIYQAAQVIMLLADKAMDLDSWLGLIDDTLEKSIAYLTEEKSQGESEGVSHE